MLFRHERGGAVGLEVRGWRSPRWRTISGAPSRNLVRKLAIFVNFSSGTDNPFRPVVSPVGQTKKPFSDSGSTNTRHATAKLLLGNRLNAVSSIPRFDRTNRPCFRSGRPGGTGMCTGPASARSSVRVHTSAASSAGQP